MAEKVKKQKIFLNAMDSWFSNFIIEAFRTDHQPDSKFQNEFMGTINDSESQKLPMYFQPKIIKFEFNTAYENPIFSNDIIIYNLNTGNTRELEYIISGLKTKNYNTEKILIIISNIMTWSKTPEKIKSEDPNEIIFIHPDDIKEEKKENKEGNNDNENNNENINDNNEEVKENEEKQSFEENKDEKKVIKEDDISKVLSNKTLSEKKEENEDKKIIVYYTDKDYLNRKSNSKYYQYLYVENIALLLNQKKNIKSYVICPGFIYGYGEKIFYYFFRNAILNYPMEEIILDKGRNIIPTIHMKDLINLIIKIIEKKPDTYYILAFDLNQNRTLKNIIKSIYECVGDIDKMMPLKENLEDNNNEENKDEEKKEENEEQINSNKNDNNVNNNNDVNNKENGDDLLDKETIEKNDENKTIPETKKISFFSIKKFNISPNFPRDILYLDVKLLPSEFIKGEPKKIYFNESDSENGLKPKFYDSTDYTPLFKWHAQNGISSNLNSIKKEFIKYRNLSQNKILVLGNPYVGKTELSKILSKIFHLPLINIKMISDYGKNLSSSDNSNENTNMRKNSIEKDLIRDIKIFMKELEDNRAIAEDNYNKRKDKKKNDPPFDENKYYRFNDELLVRILEQRLLKNDTSIYGYIIDGFPKNATQANELMESFEKNSSNMPDSILIFDNVEDEFLINRIKSDDKFPKDPKDPQANIILDKVNKRLGKIKENRTQKEYIDLVDFFKNGKYNDKILYLDAKKELLDIVKESQEFIMKNNGDKINQNDEILQCDDYLYDYIKEQEMKKAQEEKENELNNEPENHEQKINDDNNNKNINEEKIEENKEKEQEQQQENKDSIIEENKSKNSEPEIKSKIDIEADNKFKLLEKKSEVLRRYLAENVLPLLSFGILQVATERPDDPVEALADFLLEKTLEIEKEEQEKKKKEKEIKKE